MIVVDENFPESEAERLRSKGIHVRQVGKDFGDKGTQDENVLVLLLRKRQQPTLFTLDRDYYYPKLVHAHYALVWLDIAESRVAEFCWRLLRHPEFDTKSKRAGKVIRLAVSGITYWEVNGKQEEYTEWNE